jgi:arylsulfatase A-like enzyme
VTLLDAEVRVPLIVKLPDSEHAGLHVPWQVRTIDLAPTLVDVAGYGPPEAWAGRSLFDDEFDEELSTRLRPPPPWRDDEPDDPAEPPPSPPTIPSWDAHPASRPAVLEQWAAGYHLAGLRAHGRAIVRALRMPAANPLGLSARELYDLTADPDERRDLAGTGLEWEESMARALDAQLDAAGAQVLVAPESTPQVY